MGQNRAFGQWGSNGEQGGVNLMRVEIHLGVGDGLGDLVHAASAAAKCSAAAQYFLWYSTENPPSVVLDPTKHQPVSQVVGITPALVPFAAR